MFLDKFVSYITGRVLHVQTEMLASTALICFLVNCDSYDI